MKKQINYIIREVQPEHTDFSYYFDDDGLTAAGGDYCYNLFIVAQSRNSGGFNEKEYQSLQTEIENLLEMYVDIVNKSNYAQYSSVGAMLKDYKLIDNIHNTNRIKAFTAFFADCCEKPVSPYANYRDNFIARNEEMTAQYLTLKTGKQWDTDSAHGYSQGDYVEGVFCTEAYTDGIQNYLEVWLGRAKEFVIITLDDSGNEIDQRGGYFVAESEAWKPEDIKKLICGWEGIKEEEADLMLIGGADYTTTYHYDTF